MKYDAVSNRINKIIFEVLFVLANETSFWIIPTMIDARKLVMYRITNQPSGFSTSLVNNISENSLSLWIMYCVMKGYTSLLSASS